MDQIKCSLQPAPAGMVSRGWPKHVPNRNLITCFILFFCCFPATQTDWHAVRFHHDWGWSCCKFVCKPFHIFACIKWSRNVAHDRRFKAFVTYLPLVFPTNWWDVFRFEVAWRFSKTARCRLMQEVDKGVDAKNVNTLVARNQNHEMSFQLCRPFSNFVSLKRTFQTENVRTIRHFCC